MLDDEDPEVRAAAWRMLRTVLCQRIGDAKARRRTCIAAKVEVYEYIHAI